MYNLHEAYLDVYESRKNMPGELRPTVIPRSREQNIGKFDDWKHQTPETWEGKTAEEKAASRLKSRASAVVQTQRRQDREVGIRKEELDIILNYLLDEGYVDTEQAAEKIMLVMSENWIYDILNESNSAENEEKERTRNNSTQLSRLRREIRQLGAQGKPVPDELQQQATKLAKEVRLASQAAAALNKDKPRPRTVPGLGDTPQTPSTGPRAPRQRRSDETTPETQQANSILGSSVERGATHVIRTSDGKTMRVALNSTRRPIQIRTDATKSEIRSGTSRPIDRPEVGRDLGPEKSAENAPTSFRRKPR